MILSQTPAVAVFPSSGSASRTLWGLRRGKAICLLKFIPETVYYPSWPKYFKQLSALISSLAKNIFKKKSIMRFSPQRQISYLFNVLNVHPHFTGLTDVSVPQALATFSQAGELYLEVLADLTHQKSGVDFSSPVLTKTFIPFPITSLGNLTCLMSNSLKETSFFSQSYHIYINIQIYVASITVHTEVASESIRKTLKLQNPIGFSTPDLSIHIISHMGEKNLTNNRRRYKLLASWVLYSNSYFSRKRGKNEHLFRRKNTQSCFELQFSSVQSLSHVRLFVTPWTAAYQASLSITNSWSLLKLMP